MEYLAISLMAFGSVLTMGGVFRLNHTIARIGVAIALLFTPIFVSLLYCVGINTLL